MSQLPWKQPGGDPAGSLGGALEFPGGGTFPRGKLIRSSVLFSPSQHGLMASLIAHLNSMIKTSPMGPRLLRRGWLRLRFGKGTARESPRADSLGLCRAGPWPIPGRDASRSSEGSCLSFSAARRCRSHLERQLSGLAPASRPRPRPHPLPPAPPSSWRPRPPAPTPGSS